MRIKFILFLLLTIVIANFHICNVRAIDSRSASNITVRPFLENINITQSDSTKQFDLTISNNSNFKQIFHLTSINFGTLNETGGLTFEGSSANKLKTKYGLANWLRIGSNNIELSPEEQKVVKITIDNRKDLAAGAHYAAIITTASKTISSAQQLTITPKVSTLVFATKLGGEFYNIHLASISHNGDYLHRPSEVVVRLRSTGNTYITPRGVVSLKQARKVVSRGIINAQSSIVLPESTRSFAVPITEIAKPGSGIFFTKYIIEIDYRYDGINNFASKQYSFTSFNPVALVILVLVIIGLIIAIAQKKLRRSIFKIFTYH